MNAYPLRLLLAASCLAVLPLRAGTIVGVVRDGSNGPTLAGAQVIIVGTALRAVTDDEGRFRFADLHPGQVTIEVDYTGRQATTQVVSVPDKGDVATLIDAGGVIQLGDFVVEGYRAGRSKAVQEKESATNVEDLISADAIGNLPDHNVAAAIGRLPGVGVSLNDGEAEYVSVRGIYSDLNQVTIDGQTMAAPGGFRLGRSVPLDVLSASQVSQVDVVKTLTPDMDANSLGGTVNIKTMSGFDYPESTVIGSVNASHNIDSNRTGHSFDATYGTTFGPKKTWGIAASVSDALSFFSNDTVQSNSWTQTSANGISTWLPSGLEMHPEWDSSERYGTTINLEWHPDDNTQLYIRPIYTRELRWTSLDQIIYSTDPTQISLTSPTTGIFNANGNRLEVRSNQSRENQDLFNLSSGFKKIFGQLTVSGSANYSGATDGFPQEQWLQFRDSKGNPGNIQFDVTDFKDWGWTPAASAFNPATFPLRTTRDDGGNIKEHTYSGTLDFRWDTPALLSNFPGYLQSGIKVIDRDRVSDLPSNRLTPVGNWTLANVGVLPGRPALAGYYNTGIELNWNATWAYIRNNPSLTTYDTADSVQNSVADNYKINEYISSAYTMGSIDFGKNATLMAGVRAEHTEDILHAVEYRTANGAFAGLFPQYGSTDYTQVLPNIQLRLNPAKQFVVRAAITETIGRPAYEDARPYSTFTYSPLGASSVLNPAFPDSGTLVIGNPTLKPFQSTNLDLSMEYYTPQSGVLSWAIFRKDIKNPIYNFLNLEQNVAYEGVGLESLNVTETENAPAAQITGSEWDIYEPFRFLPSPFDGFGVDTNFTLIKSNVNIPTRPGESFGFFRQPSTLANATIFYEKSRYSIRIAWRYEGRELYTLGTGALSDIYRRPFNETDIQGSLQISKHLLLTLSVQNVARFFENYTYGKTNFLRTSQDLGREFDGGIRFNY